MEVAQPLASAMHIFAGHCHAAALFHPGTYGKLTLGEVDMKWTLLHLNFFPVAVGSHLVSHCFVQLQAAASLAFNESCRPTVSPHSTDGSTMHGRMHAWKKNAHNIVRPRIWYHAQDGLGAVYPAYGMCTAG